MTGRMEEDKTGKEESHFTFRASLCLFLDGSELEQTVGEQKNDTVLHMGKIIVAANSGVPPSELHFLKSYMYM